MSRKIGKILFHEDHDDIEFDIIIWCDNDNDIMSTDTFAYVYQHLRESYTRYALGSPTIIADKAKELCERAGYNCE